MKTLMAAMAVVLGAVLAFHCDDSAAAEKTLALKLAEGVEMKLILIPAGKFTMGSPEAEKDRNDDEKQHEVTISQAFYMGIFEVTQAQYNALTGKNPSVFKDGSLPVETVSWEEAIAFCKKASEKTGRIVRLPTEAEWEYACRAGSTTRFSFGDDDNDLGTYAWYDRSSDKKTHPAGQKKPNGWGLYDMHGNVWEWCSDWYGPYANPTETDPKGAATGEYRVARGGSWCFPAQTLRSAFRGFQRPDFCNYTGGFRVVCVAGGD